MAQIIETFWDLEATQKVWDRRAEYQVNEACVYFLDRVNINLGGFILYLG